ncbi:RND transporter [Bordetella genomosp. 10]|uniref:RND transporter n=1 Tax=Bordetella genomosp. 10 TaxID=1416804 RepID=A0A261SDL5_9BORD|nr:RND transporter [Bordetella genomosp. 10]
MRGDLQGARRQFFAVLAATLLSGCISSAPPAPPPLPVQAAWPADTADPNAPQAAATPQETAAAADLPWRGFFTDARLQSLIEKALDNNRDLRAAVSRVEQARAAYGIQRSALFPQIEGDAQATRSRVPGDLNLTGRPVTASTYGLSVGLTTWELDLWGRVRSLKDAALQDFLATRAAQSAIRVSLIGQVANGYLGLRELDERIALADRTVASRQESLRIFTRRYEVGSISKLDLTQVDTLLRQAQALRVQLAQSRANQAHALGLLVGSADELEALPVPAQSDDAVFRPLRPGLPADLLVSRPDIAAAEHALQAAHANIRAARAAFFPRIALTGDFGTASAELDGLFKHGSRAWSFTPTLALPLFDGGQRSANLDLARARANEAVADYEKTIQTAFREVADALSDRRWLAEQVGIQRATLEVQTERARLAQLRYDSGAAAYLEVLDAQRDLLEAQQQLVQVRRGLLSSNVTLYAALGGGAIDPPAQSDSR